MDSRTKNAPLKFRRRADARPDEVLDAALELFTRQGFAATRMEDIAGKAGISKATIYLYFASKDALLEALVQRAVVPNIRQAQTAVAQFPGTQAQAISALFGILEQAFSDPKTLAVPLLILREAGTFPAIAAMYRRQVIDQIRPVFTGLYQRGIDAGEFRQADPERALRSMIGPVLANVLLTRLFGIGDDNVASHAAFFTHHRDMLAHGILRDPEGSL